MTWYDKIWNWLNGNKVTIGLVLGYLLSQVWFVNLVSPEIADALRWVADTFLGIGILHKVVKATTTPEPNQ
jgi:hypothetical protein